MEEMNAYSYDTVLLTSVHLDVSATETVKASMRFDGLLTHTTTLWNPVPEKLHEGYKIIFI